jgi:hypothetical protein
MLNAIQPVELIPNCFSGGRHEKTTGFHADRATGRHRHHRHPDWPAGPCHEKVREAAAHTQCQNNLKQIALACISYHDGKKAFPQGVVAFWDPAPPEENGVHPREYEWECSGRR